jgi:hypothetical protein
LSANVNQEEIAAGTLRKENPCITFGKAANNKYEAR